MMTNTDNSVANALADLYGEHSVEVPGLKRKARVYLVKLKNAAVIMDVFRGLLDEAKVDVSTLRYGADSTEKQSMILNLISNCPDRIQVLLPILTDISAEEVGELDIADTIDVLGAVIEVNLDFFTRKVIPSFHAAVQKVQAKANL